MYGQGDVLIDGKNASLTSLDEHLGNQNLFNTENDTIVGLDGDHGSGIVTGLFGIPKSAFKFIYFFFQQNKITFLILIDRSKH